MADDFKRVKEAVDLKEYASDHLEHVRGGFVCPACGSGTGPNKTPAFGIKGKEWKCFSASCGKGGDVFDLAGIIHNTEDKREQLRLVAEWAGITLEDGEEKSGGFKKVWTERSAKEKEEKKETEPAPDYTEGRAKHRAYIAECARRMREEPNAEIDSYLSARGIDHAQAVKIGIGYDLNYKGRGGHRIVIPWAGCDYYHIDRDVKSDGEGKYNKPESKEVGPQPPYNPAGLGHDYIIVVEGVLDAIAIRLCGYNAAALCGTASHDFVEQCQARRYPGIVVEMLDADGDAADAKNGKGRKAGAQLVADLEAAGVHTFSRAEYGIEEADTYGGHKDAAEWYAADRDGLAAMLDVMRGLAVEKLERIRGREYAEALRALKVEDAAQIAAGLLELADPERPISTGLRGLDRAINGGLRAGLTVLGAVSSAGKTTLLNQIADNIARTGKPVLFVSIEQSGRELVTKSLSRAMQARGYAGVSYWEMTSAEYRAKWPEEKAAALADAAGEYAREIAPCMHIMAAYEQPTIEQVKAAAYEIARRGGESPVIFIDYLQILKPLDDRMPERKAVDGNISELRRLAGPNGLNTPVVVISSLNRASYTGAIEMDSFKESGGVEYGADVLIGLQPGNMEARLQTSTKDGKPLTEQQMRFKAKEIVDAFRREAVKAAEIVVLKNRNGALPEKPVPITFEAASCLFMDAQN